MTESRATNVDVVNVCEDDDTVIVMLKLENKELWQWFRLTHSQSVQLADQLRLLTHTTD